MLGVSPAAAVLGRAGASVAFGCGGASFAVTGAPGNSYAVPATGTLSSWSTTAYTQDGAQELFGNMITVRRA
jgi:hypothetical protein